jgi:hypothetical protein
MYRPWHSWFTFHVFEQSEGHIWHTTYEAEEKVYNRIQHLKRLFSPNNKTQFTTVLQLRGFDKIASEIDQDKVVPKYALSRAFSTPTRSTPSATSLVAYSVAPLVTPSHHSTTTKKEQNTAP